MPNYKKTSSGEDWPDEPDYDEPDEDGFTLEEKIPLMMGIGSALLLTPLVMGYIIGLGAGQGLASLVSSSKEVIEQSGNIGSYIGTATGLISDIIMIYYAVKKE